MKVLKTSLFSSLANYFQDSWSCRSIINLQNVHWPHKPEGPLHTSGHLHLLLPISSKEHILFVSGIWSCGLVLILMTARARSFTAGKMKTEACSMCSIWPRGATSGPNCGYSGTSAKWTAPRGLGEIEQSAPNPLALVPWTSPWWSIEGDHLFPLN